MNDIFLAADDIALVNVDIQNTFCPGGKLAVNEGDEIIPIVNKLRDYFKTVVNLRDSHPANHKSFASQHEGAQPFSVIETSYGPQTLWPDHGIDGTEDAEFHKDFIVKPTDLILKKGRNAEIDSYSGFYENDGVSRPLFDNDNERGKSLTEVFKERGIKTVVLTGLAYDYCVGWNALDAVKDGFNVIVVKDATRSIAMPTENGRTTENDMTEALVKAGVRIVHSSELKLALAA